MDKKYKILLYTFVGLLGLFGLVFIANKIIKQKIKAGIEKELVNSNVTYEEITVDVVSGSATVSKPNLKLGDATISSQELRVIDLDYMEYFSNKKIVFNKIVFEKPEIHISESDAIKEEENENSDIDFKEDIKIKHLVIEEGELRISKNDTLDKGLYLSLKYMDIYDLHITERSLKNKIPFDYREVAIESDSLFYSLNPDHDLFIHELKLKKNTLNITDLKIIPKYSKVEFDRRQPIENDRFVLDIQQITMDNFVWSINEENLHLESTKAQIEKANFNIYRNKLLPDDTSIKPLYSKKLRDLGTRLNFPEIKISNSRIVYEEKTKEGSAPGKVIFSELEATISNLSNLEKNPSKAPATTIEAKTKFMEESTLNFKMEFDINDLEDKFNFSGNLAGISAQAMNSFLKPALNIEVEGKISSMFFNFYGNNDSALGDTRLQYHDFKVEVLKKDGVRKNKFLSGLVNLVLRSDVSNKKMNQKNISAVRDKTKSFWNFLWLCIRNGALKSFI